VTAVVAFTLAVQFGGPTALALASSIGIPTDENAGKALALGVASAVVWAAFCPIAVYVGGRPAKLGFGECLRIFLEPWLVTLPVIAALVATWIGLRGLMPETVADALTICVIAPIAALVAIFGCAWMRESTRADMKDILDRFIRRRKSSP
jgi:hypothetical protein